MYIIYPCKKDTYITNRSYLNTDGKYSNFGRSSTIDLYKIYNENSQIKQQAILKLTNIPVNGSEFKFKNHLDIEYIFKFDNTVDSEDSGQIVNNRIIIGIKDINQISTIVDLIKSTINSPYKNIIVDTHSVSGLIGITLDKLNFTKTVNIELNSNAIQTNLQLIQDFSRIEYSIGLLQFDLEEENEYFSFDVVKNHIQMNLSLKDINSGVSKPKDYDLVVLPLCKSFNEGLGRDVYNLKDIDSANFILSNYDGQNNQKYYWETSGSLGLIKKANSVSNADLLTSWQGYNFLNCKQNFLESENLDIDITNIYNSFWHATNPIINNGMAIVFDDLSLYDDETYFAKRFASSHVRNKFLKPTLNILIDDESYYVNQNQDFYFNIENSSMLYNKIGNTYSNIKKVGNNNSIIDIEDGDMTLTITSINTYVSNPGNPNANPPVPPTLTPVYQDEFDVYQLKDIKNNKIKGNYYSKWTINSLLNDDITELLETNSSLEFKFEWYSQNGLGQTILVNSENKKIYKSIINSTNTFKRLRSSVKLYSPDLSITDVVHKLTVTFYDIDAQHDAVKTPFQLEGLDVGNVFYEVIDYDTREILIPLTKTKNATRCIKEKDYYWFPFFNSSIFYGRRIQFIFKVDQFEFNNLSINANEIFKVGNNG